MLVAYFVNFFSIDKSLLFVQLRLLYECIPMAYIIEQAGGKATSGTMDILDIVPQSIHQRTPIFLGSKEDIEDIVKIFKKYEQTQ